MTGIAKFRIVQSIGAVQLAARVVFAIAIAGLLILQCAAIRAAVPVALDHDEGEYLHASWLMSQGKRIYRDFMEDHPPALFQFLTLIQPVKTTPEYPLLDVSTWAARARIFTGLCGTFAALCAGIACARATRNRAAGVLTAAAILGSYWTVWRGMLQIRADAPTLFLFWAGVALLIGDEDSTMAAAVRRGVGMALVVAAEFENPKWPLCGLVLGLFFLRDVVRAWKRDRRSIAVMIAPSVAVLAALIAWTLRVTSLRDFLFFNFELKSANMKRFLTAPWIVATFGRTPPFTYTSLYTRPWIIAIALVLSCFLLWRRRERPAVPVVELLALMVAAAIEVRFVYTYPYLWPQYYLMWSFAGAVILGITAALLFESIATFARSEALLIASAALSLIVSTSITTRFGIGDGALNRVIIAVSILAAWLPTVIMLSAVAAKKVVPAGDLAPLWILTWAIVIAFPNLLVIRRTDERLMTSHWQAMSYMQRTLREGDTVWMSATIHPIGVADASYFWYSPQDLIPNTLEYIRTHPESRQFLPAVTDDSLPPCALLHGEPSSLRYVMMNRTMLALPQSARCLAELYQRGVLVRTPVPDIVEVRRQELAP